MAIDYTKGDSASASPVSLHKVVLTKSAPAVSLTKAGAATGYLRVNLNWTTPPGHRGIDLDLACLWEFHDGQKGVVQALGAKFAVYDPYNRPIIWLDGDDRSGSHTTGENLYMDLRFAALIRRVLIFTYIYEGAPNWAAANAVVTMTPDSGPQFEVRLDEHDPRSPLCAIAMLYTSAGELVVQREVRYIHGGQGMLDRTYQWGLRWGPGSK